MSKRVNNKRGNRAKRKKILGEQTKVRGRSHGDQNFKSIRRARRWRASLIDAG